MSADWLWVWDAIPREVVDQLATAGFSRSTRERCANMYDEDDPSDLDDFVASLLKEAVGDHDPDWVRDCLEELQLCGQCYSVGLKRRRLLRDSVETSGAYLLGDSLRLSIDSAARARVLQVGGMSERKVADWGTRRGRLLAQAELTADPSAARATCEESERKRWAEAFGRFLMEVGAPVADGATLERMSLAVGKRRPRRNRARLRTARRISQYMRLGQQESWVRSPEDFLDYVEMRVLEPCGRTVPFEILKALMLVEHLGHFTPRVSGDVLVRNSVESWSASLAVGAPEVRKAPDYCIVMLISLLSSSC